MWVSCTLVLLLSGWVTSQNIEILEYINEVLPDKYNFRYVTSDGVVREESGRFREDGVWEVRGSFAYTDPDGVRHTTRFVADDKGYRILRPNFKHRLSPGTLASLAG